MEQHNVCRHVCEGQPNHRRAHQHRALPPALTGEARAAVQAAGDMYPPHRCDIAGSLPTFITSLFRVKTPTRGVFTPNSGHRTGDGPPLALLPACPGRGYETRKLRTRQKQSQSPYTLTTRVPLSAGRQYYVRACRTCTTYFVPVSPHLLIFLQWEIESDRWIFSGGGRETNGGADGPVFPPPSVSSQQLTCFYQEDKRKTNDGRQTGGGGRREDPPATNTFVKVDIDCIPIASVTRRGKRQRTRTGRGPDAGRTIESEENGRGPDADRTRAWPLFSHRPCAALHCCVVLRFVMLWCSGDSGKLRKTPATPVRSLTVVAAFSPVPLSANTPRPRSRRVAQSGRWLLGRRWAGRAQGGGGGRSVFHEFRRGTLIWHASREFAPRCEPHPRTARTKWGPTIRMRLRTPVWDWCLFCNPPLTEGTVHPRARSGCILVQEAGASSCKKQVHPRARSAPLNGHKNACANSPVDNRLSVESRVARLGLPGLARLRLEPILPVKCGKAGDEVGKGWLFSGLGSACVAWDLAGYQHIVPIRWWENGAHLPLGQALYIFQSRCVSQSACHVSSFPAMA
eukprot:gene8191-biopygen9144